MTKYIIISGVDGSGKTTVINELRKAIENKGFSVSYIWMRFNHYTVKVMNAVARVLGLSVKVKNEMGEIWEHRLYKMPWFCKIYVLCSYVDNKFAVRKVLKQKTDYVICDRWINDIIIDLAAETKQPELLNSRWYDKFHSIIPVNSYEFVIMRDRQAVLDCRLENKVNPFFDARFGLYNELMKKSNVIVVDNTGCIDDSVAQILGVVNRL